MKIKINRITTLISLILFVLVAVNIVSSSVAQTTENADKQQGATSEDIAVEKVLNVHLFYSYTCPHCEKEREFLEQLKIKYPNVNFAEYEITKSRDNLKLFADVGNKLGDRSGSVPFLVIGTKYITGYLDSDSFRQNIENQIIKAIEEKPEDIVERVITENSIKESIKEETKKKNTPANIEALKEIKIKLPLLGEKNAGEVSLPILTFLIGLLDGFNPCAMWILLFLISLLLGMKDRRKMWIIGGAFILTSAITYFVFMAAWLNFFLIIGYAAIVRIAIGILATALGIYYLWDFYKNRNGGCEIVEEDKRKNIFEKIKKIVSNNNIVLAVGGIMLVAVGVNLLEIMCSAGLPAIYTKILTLNSMTKLQYYMYLLFYVFIFMLDDLIVFVTAMVTLQASGVESKYARYSHLVGGIIILIIGVLMLLKPEVLMFG